MQACTQMHYLYSVEQLHIQQQQQVKLSVVQENDYIVVPGLICSDYIVVKNLNEEINSNCNIETHVMFRSSLILSKK